jgi:hypothetical protein
LIFPARFLRLLLAMSTVCATELTATMPVLTDKHRMNRTIKTAVERPEIDPAALTFLHVVDSVTRHCPTAVIERHDMVQGDMTFSVPVAELGHAGGDITTLKQMLRTRFYADVVAELILRRNVHQFLDHVAEDTLYEFEVRLGAHEHFGVGFDEGRLFFFFHVSKLAEVANEQIHQELKWPNRK